MCVITAAVAGSAAMATMANIGIATSVLGTGMSVMGSVQQSKAQKAQASYQAKVADTNAKTAEYYAQDALERGQLEEKRHKAQVSALKGRQRSALAASGVELDSGSPLDILADTAELGELDALTIRSNAEREAYGHRVQGMNFKADGALARGRASSISPLMAGGTSLLSGAGSVADKWYRFGRK